MNYLSLLVPLTLLTLCVASQSKRDEMIVEITDKETLDPVPVDDFGMERELTSLEEVLRVGKQRFKQLWRILKARQTYDDVTDFNGSIQSFYDETRRLRASLSSHLRSLNSFLSCLNSCTIAHSDDSHTASEANIHYFCNRSCLMALEHPDKEEEHTTSQTLIIVG